MKYHFTANQIPIYVPEHKPSIYSIWVKKLWAPHVPLHKHKIHESLLFQGIILQFFVQNDLFLDTYFHGLFMIYHFDTWAIIWQSIVPVSLKICKKFAAFACQIVFVIVSE